MARPTTTPRGAWIEEGLRALGAGGPAAVRIEVIATALGVTKGGFYGHFADRDTFLAALLETWERESVDEAIAAVAHEGLDTRSRIYRLATLTFSDDRLLPVDLAIRDWARHDPAVAARLRRVDNRRMDELRAAIGTFCEDPLEIEARSLLAFCAAIGEHFLAAEHGAVTRAQVLERAAEVVLRPSDAR